MSRQRFIYPRMFEDSDDFHALSIWARTLWVGLFTLADDHGKGKGSPRVLRGRVFPHDDISDAAVESMCVEIAARKMAVFYRVEGTIYYRCLNWKRYQTPKYVGRDLHPSVGASAEVLYNAAKKNGAGATHSDNPPGTRPEPGPDPGGTRASNSDSGLGSGLGVVGSSWEGKLLEQATAAPPGNGLPGLDSRTPDEDPDARLTPEERARAAIMRDGIAALRRSTTPPEPEAEEPDGDFPELPA